jgi:adenylate cyclase
MVGRPVIGEQDVGALGAQRCSSMTSRSRTSWGSVISLARVPRGGSQADVRGGPLVAWSGCMEEAESDGSSSPRSIRLTVTGLRWWDRAGMSTPFPRTDVHPGSEGLDEKVVLDAGQPLVRGGAIIRGVEQLPGYLPLDRPVSDPALVTDRTPADVEKANRILRSLSELARALLTAQPADVPPRVMDALFEHIAAERGFMMLFDEEGKLRPRVVKYRAPAPDGGQITVSKTIVDRVVRERVSIMTSDARVDPRFGAADSVRSFNLRSAMCAPLWKGQKVIGIVHVDSSAHAGVFTVADLDLLTAMSNYAAVAIEQSCLNEKIREEHLARERLEKYFSPAVVTRILSEGERDVQELEATVVFADIVGFSRLTEKMQPREVAQLLNEYFSRMADAIFEHDGTVDKFIGDCIMAVFGAPYAQSDHAVRAVRVAVEMRRRLALLNAERRPQRPIEMRVGINSGRVVAGPIGSSKRKEITVLGDTVNIASRIESTIAKPGLIVVGQRTSELVEDLFALKDLGTVTLRGKDERLNVYEVLGERG